VRRDLLSTAREHHARWHQHDLPKRIEALGIPVAVIPPAGGHSSDGYTDDVAELRLRVDQAAAAAVRARDAGDPTIALTLEFDGIAHLLGELSDLLRAEMRELR
jgi:hypothetical protein